MYTQPRHNHELIMLFSPKHKLFYTPMLCISTGGDRRSDALQHLHSTGTGLYQVELRLLSTRYIEREEGDSNYITDRPGSPSPRWMQIWLCSAHHTPNFILSIGARGGFLISILLPTRTRISARHYDVSCDLYSATSGEGPQHAPKIGKHT